MTTHVTLDGTTQLVGIIGWPVKHSLSPRMHNAAFAATGLNWAYVPLPVPPDRVQDAVQGLRALGFRGANVTIPHKQTVMRYLDRITPEAQAIGAVNTIVVDTEGTLWGTNTDARGILDDLRAHNVPIQGERVLILGAGGAAHAVAYALAREGARITIANCTESRAIHLVRRLHAVLPGKTLAVIPLTREALAAAARTHTLLVNTTNVGMWPHVDASPWPEGEGFGTIRVVYDVIYRPRETRLLREARAAGCRTIDGLGMLVRQGAEAWRLWTGHPPPVDVMWRAVEHSLSER